MVATINISHLITKDQSVENIDDKFIGDNLQGTVTPQKNQLGASQNAFINFKFIGDYR
jgi:hypothetical protein